MVADNGLVLLIVLPQDTDILDVSVNMGFNGLYRISKVQAKIKRS